MKLSDRQRAWVAGALVLGYVVWIGNGFYLEHLATTNPMLFWAADLFQWIVLPTGIVIALKAFAGLGVKDYGFAFVDEMGVKRLGDAVGVFITAGFMFFVVRNGVQLYLDLPDGLNFANALPQGTLRKAAVLFYWSVSAGLVESALFIGLPWLLWGGAASKFSRLSFLVLTSSLFAIAHWESGTPVVFGAFASNIVLCLWYFHYKSLWPVAGGHFLTDILAFS